MNYRSFMPEALAEAHAAAAEGEVPVGAVVVEDGRIVATGRNRTTIDADPTAHAEIVALRAAARRLGNERLGGCDLWVTLEPCPMCAAAISFARIRRLYYGAADPKGGAVESGLRLYSQPTCHHVPEVYSGLAAGEAGDLLKGFFRARR
jgi:tRNA(adenine34) deaminase